MDEPAAPPPPPARAGSACGLQLALVAVLALFGAWQAQRLSRHVRAPALLYVDDLGALVDAADRLMATPASHGLYGESPDVGPGRRPLAALPGPLVAARPGRVRVEAHEVVLAWPDDAGRAITVFSDDDEGRRRAEALGSAPRSDVARERVHPRAWASHEVR